MWAMWGMGVWDGGAHPGCMGRCVEQLAPAGWEGGLRTFVHGPMAACLTDSHQGAQGRMLAPPLTHPLTHTHPQAYTRP